jgi:hypothetical protein
MHSNLALDGDERSGSQSGMFIPEGSSHSAFWTRCNIELKRYTCQALYGTAHTTQRVLIFLTVS